jgi:hypothetical protein
MGTPIDIDSYAVVWTYVKKAQEEKREIDRKLWRRILRRYPSLIIYNPAPSDRLREIARETMNKLNGDNY